MKNKHRPERTCVFCRRKFYKEELYRFVKGDSGYVMENNGGRGVYVCRDCLAKVERFWGIKIEC